jgi:hypothetical protein
MKGSCRCLTNACCGKKVSQKNVKSQRRGSRASRRRKSEEDEEEEDKDGEWCCNDMGTDDDIRSMFPDQSHSDINWMEGQDKMDIPESFASERSTNQKSDQLLNTIMHFPRIEPGDVVLCNSLH